MGIWIDAENRLFTLETKGCSYQLKADEYGFVHHLYYGAPVGQADMSYTEYFADIGFSPNPAEWADRRTFSLDVVSQEYTGCGAGDFRVSCLSVQNADGSFSADLRYQGYELLEGKYAIPGMPASHAEASAAQTLILHLQDPVTKLEVDLLYGVFEDSDVIARSAVIRNGADTPVSLHRAASMCLDIPFGEWELIHFHGRHNGERQKERLPVMNGVQTVSSTRGASSHQHNPFVILAQPHAGEDAGECIGAMLVYSGSYRIDVERSQMGGTRIAAGVNDDRFCWTLAPGEAFHTPEVLLCRSGAGLGALSQAYHDFIMEHVCRGKFVHAPRPVLINNWEATYFDFDAKKILDIAAQAGELGVDMLVLDDGWFGGRVNDFTGLGDWFVNEEKLGCPLRELIDGVHGMGMKFGLWIEPEMVSPGTKLLAQHPDWALTVPGRAPTLGRSQLVLDMSRQDVVDDLYDCFAKILTENPIDYIKWDMNRHMTDVFSHALSAGRQGEVHHRYILGVYQLLERLTQGFPDVLFEGCSGGGGRFDAGMLYYHPQIWCSDDTDPIERLRIQYGTSFGYPVAAVGSHVSASPNHQTGRSTPIHTRAVVAMSGTFGYELDLQLITPEEKEAVRQQTAAYKRLQPLIQHGLYFRLTDAMQDRVFTAWQFAARDAGRALLNVVVVAPQPTPRPMHVRLKGLDPLATYRETASGRTYTGAALMHGGYTLPAMYGDYPALQLEFEKI